jgi:predicted dehydrogenase
LRAILNILATEPTHPYIDAWWPPGHIIGYEHTFVNAMADFLNAMGARTKVLPNFVDGVREMANLEAALQSAQTGRTVEVLTGAVGEAA